jgi:hypothetical protein
MKIGIPAVAVALLLSWPAAWAGEPRAPQAVMDAWQAMAQPCEADSSGGEAGRSEASGREEGLADKICDTPANLTGPILVATEYSSPFRPAIVWDGGAYGVAWMASIGSGLEIYFARVAADGTVLVPMTRASTSSGSAYRPAIAWSGSQYAIAWDDTRGTNYEVFLALIDASGTKIGGDITVTTDDSFDSYRPSIAWNGSGYGIAWADERDGQYEMYFALLDATGTKTTGDLPITSDDNLVSDIPSLVWTGSEYGLAWQDARHGATEIYFNRISAAGAPLIVDYRVTNDAATSQVPVLAWAGTQYGVAWYDARTTVQDVYFARISVLGVKIGSDVQITSDAATSAIPSLVWTGAEFGVTWEDNRDAGEYEIYFQRISIAGAKVGSEMRLTVDGAPSRYPVLAFGTLGYGLAYALDDLDKITFIGLGCHADTTPPSCPANLTVTGNSGFGVTLLWEPGVDLQTQVAYHRVYRDGSLLGVTTESTYTDTSRPAGILTYTVTAVNANGWESAGCAAVTAPEPEGGCGEPLTDVVTVAASPSSTATSASIAWDGAAYGIAWRDDRNGNGEIYFARVASDGAVIVPARRITTASGTSDRPSLVWTGTEYGLAWEDLRDSHYQIYFNRLALDGTPGTDSKPFPHATSVERYPSLVWTGSGYGLAWEDDRDVATYEEIYFWRIDASGTPVAGGPLRVTSSDSTSSSWPSLTWTGSVYGIAWNDRRGSQSGIYFTRISTAGVEIGDDVLISSTGSAFFSFYDSTLVWTGAEFGVVWYEYDVLGMHTTDVLLARISAEGAKIGSNVTVSNAATYDTSPSLVWTGSEYAVAWQAVSGSFAWIEGVSVYPTGSLVGEARRYTPAGADNRVPDLAVGGRGLGLTFQANLTSDEIRFIGLGCGVEDTTPPPCPSSPAETARTSTTVTLGWGPSYEAESDFGHYAIFKDGVEYAATLATTYTDASFNPAAGPIYQVLATNAAGYASVGCPGVDTADYDPPECPAGLMITWNSASSLTLKWLPVLDPKSGLKQYKVYKNDVFLTNVVAGTTTYTDASVSAGTTYSFAVLAEDYAGNLSTGCLPLSTQDGAPPTCPGNLQATAASSTSITLSWLPSVDTGGGLRQYKVYRNDVVMSNVAAGTTTYTDAAVVAEVTYTYAVLAEDWAGNLSAGCGSVSVTATNGTGACGEPWTEPVVVSASTSWADSPQAAWDGSAYGVVWRDWRDGNYEIYFARVAPDGSVLVPAARVTNQAATSEAPSIAWTGSEYGVAWSDSRTTTSDIYFSRVSMDGIVLLTAQITNNASASSYPSLAWTGSEYGVSWQDTRDGNSEIYFNRISAAGAKILADDVRITNYAAESWVPFLRWTGYEYGVVWQDNRDANYEIYFNRISAVGVKVLADDLRITNFTYNSLWPKLVWTGEEFGVAWYDYRTTNQDIYFARVSASGVKQGDDVQVTNDTGSSNRVSLAWTGSEYAVAWNETRAGNDDIYYISLDADGYKVGSEQRLTSTAVAERNVALAAGGRGLGLFWQSDDAPADQIRFLGLGCGALDTTPPSCPSSPAETGRTNTTLTLGWGPSVDSESDIGHYIIYRDGNVVGVTADTTWTDSSFDPAAGYVYVITSTNAAGFECGVCASVDTSDRVQPSCVGGLQASVTTGTVTLNWVQAWDDKSGVKEYRVYRNGSLRATIAVGTNTFSEAVAAGSTYNYVVETADYAGNTNSSCTTCSVWVYGGALMLFLTKNADTVNADLDWNDVGITDYVVYRSMSPQVGVEHERVPLSETQDMVLQDGVQLWFYFIQQRE